MKNRLFLVAVAVTAAFAFGCKKAEDPAVQDQGTATSAAPAPTTKAEASSGMNAAEAVKAPPGVQTGTP